MIASVVACVALLAALLVVPAGAASAAPPTDLGWSACSFAANHQNNRLIGVFIDPAAPFPGAVSQPNLTGGTSLMSFRNGIIQGANRWGDTMVNIRPPGNPTIDMYATSSADYADVIVRYVDDVPLATTRILATTGVNDSGYCTSLRNSTHDRLGKGVVRIFQADIRVERRGDWFTAPDDQRTPWERDCPSQYNAPSLPYLCTKTWDFYSAIIHELGHTLSLVHPYNADGSRFSNVYNGPASQRAKCSYTATGTPVDQATMCGGDSRFRTAAGQGNIMVQQFRTEQRTLDPWDTASLQALHDWAFSGVVTP